MTSRLVVPVLAIALAVAALEYGCTTKVRPAPTAPGPPAGPLFTPDSVQLIFDNNCIGCHSGASPPAGMDLSADSSYSMIVNRVSIKCNPLFRIKPFDPMNSCLMSRITGRVPPRMPFGLPPLSPADTSTIRNWIQSGAPGVTI
jgi:hypothetical protein